VYVETVDESGAIKTKCIEENVITSKEPNIRLTCRKRDIPGNQKG